VLLGAVLVLFAFPKRDDEKRLLAAYGLQDSEVAPAPAAAEPVEATP
jgi:hypothetical protein